MQIKLGGLVVASVIMTVIGELQAGTFSSPVLVDATGHNRHWQAVCTNEVSLRLDWPSGSTQADLTIVGMSGSFATNVTAAVSNVLWRVFASAEPAEEDVYDLTLTFYTNGTSVAEVLSGRVAVVKGAFGGIPVDAVTASRTWLKVKTDSVLPYDAMWAAEGTNAVASQLVIAKVGGAVQTHTFVGTSGYMGWKIRNSGWGYGTFDLNLTFTGMTNEWTAELSRPLDGTAVSVR